MLKRARALLAHARGGDKGLSTLTNDVIMASASIPGAFPPEMINAEENGKAKDS